MPRSASNFIALERLDTKLKGIQKHYGGALEEIPVWVIGSTYLGLGPAANGHLAPGWVCVEKIQKNIWESALSESFTFSTFGLNPHFIAPLPLDDTWFSGDDIKKTGERKVENWKKICKKKITPHFVKLHGECPVSLYFATPTRRAQKVDPGCQVHFRWEHVKNLLRKHVDPTRKPGVLVIGSYFYTKLHEGLEDALKLFKNWLICVDFGRLDRQSGIMNESIIALRKQFDNVDVDFTSNHDMVELFFNELQLTLNEDHYSESALNKAFRRLEAVASPAVVLVKTKNQNRRLWLNTGRRNFAAKEFSYLGRDLSNVWYPHFGGIFNAAFIVSLLTSDGKTTIANRTEEATLFALSTLSHCGDQLVIDQKKAQQQKEMWEKIEAGDEKEEQIQNGVQEIFPIQSILKTCENIYEGEDRKLDPISYIRRYGPLRGLLGFRSCPEVVAAIKRALASEQSVMIMGETGTGKGHLARIIHDHGQRGGNPFFVVSLGARSEEVQSLELFGSHGDAFTGDRSEPTEGCLVKTAGGTVVLDDLQEISPRTQARLLQCTENDPRSRKVQPLGLPKKGRPAEFKIDVRFISTITKTLDQVPSLKKQLLFRLAQIRIYLPPLRERQEEIIHLAEHFIQQFLEEEGRHENLMLSSEAIQTLLHYHWPGNVRELKSAIETAIQECPGGMIGKAHLPKDIWSYRLDQVSGKQKIEENLWEKLRAEERVFVSHWFEVAPYLHKSMDENGNINWSHAARLINEKQIPLSKVQLERKLKKAVLQMKRERRKDVLELPVEELARMLLKQRTT